MNVVFGFFCSCGVFSPLISTLKFYLKQSSESNCSQLICAGWKGWWECLACIRVYQAHAPRFPSPRGRAAVSHVINEESKKRYVASSRMTLERQALFSNTKGAQFLPLLSSYSVALPVLCRCSFTGLLLCCVFHAQFTSERELRVSNSYLVSSGNLIQ